MIDSIIELIDEAADKFKEVFDGSGDSSSVMETSTVLDGLPDLDHSFSGVDSNISTVFDDSFLNETPNSCSDNISFLGNKDTLPHNANSDGYIPKGNIELTRTISDKEESFKLFTKDGHKYVLYNGSYYKVDGYGTVTIGSVTYDKIH